MTCREGAANLQDAVRPKGFLVLAGLLLVFLVVPALLQAAEPAPRVEISRVNPVAASSDGPALSVREAVAAGDTVVVRWSGIPSSAREIELLLSVDGGRTFSLRLTNELEPGSGSFLWQVPALETDRARVAIRMGLTPRDHERDESAVRGEREDSRSAERDDGEAAVREDDADEIVAASSETFTISAEGAVPNARLRWKRNEIWTDSGEDREAAESDDPLAHGSMRASGRLSALADDPDAVENPPSAAPLSFTGARRPVPVDVSSLPKRAGAEHDRSPLSMPRRI